MTRNAEMNTIESDDTSSDEEILTIPFPLPLQGESDGEHQDLVGAPCNRDVGKPYAEQVPSPGIPGKPVTALWTSKRIAGRKRDNLSNAIP